MNRLFSVLILSVLLAACNGYSGKNDTSSEVSVASAISLSIVNSQQQSGVSFDKSDTLTITAHLVDQNNAAMANVKIDFSSSLGELTPASKLTDANGDAVVTLTNSALLVSAGTITATTADISQTLDFEFIDSNAQIVPPSLTALLTLNNRAVNQFKTNESAQISATLLDENQQPLIGEIIQFLADVGSLSSASALTDENGVATVSLTGNGATGAGVASASFQLNESVSVAKQFNYQILAEDAVIIDNSIQIGYIDADNQFHQGEILTSIADNSISAGGTLGVTVDLVDANGARVTTPTPVSFTSNCVAGEHATIDQSVFSVNGRAKATFEDIDCAGISGTTDVILASVVANEVTQTAAATVNIQGEQLGSIEFVSASPNNIVLKGTGGEGKQETATLTFVVKSALGNPVSQQQVDFSLTTEVGGIELTPTTGLTNSQGMVSTQVKAGTVPTSVRVNASASLTANNETVTVQSQSDQLSINTGLPEQRSMTIGASVLNPEANSINGQTSDITVWLADSFNNPVPDGTTVNFTAEGGVIEPSCVTQNSSCTVTWTSAEPRVDDHRITILATAIGHESFFDTNGNNQFDDADGMAITDLVASSGANRIAPSSSGFFDMTEAWRDDNENQQFDVGETFFDYNNDGQFSAEDGLFNGPQCSGSLCAASTANLIHVRKSLVMVMASSQALLDIVDNSDTVLVSNHQAQTGIADIADGASQTLTLKVSDTALQTMPANTQIAVSASAGELNGTTNLTIGNTNTAGAANMTFVLTNPIGGTAEVATLTITVTSPSGVVSNLVTNINLL